MNNTQEYLDTFDFSENTDKNNLYPFNDQEIFKKIQSLLELDYNKEKVIFDELLKINNFSELKKFLIKQEGIELKKMYKDEGDSEGYHELTIEGIKVYLMKQGEDITFIGNDLDNIKAIKELDHYYYGLNIKPYYRLDNIHLADSLKYDEKGNVEVNDEGNYINIEPTDLWGSKDKYKGKLNIFDYFDKITGKLLGQGIKKYGSYFYIKDNGKRIINNYINIESNYTRLVDQKLDISYNNSTYELIVDKEGNYIYINNNKEIKHNGYMTNDSGTYFYGYDKDFNHIGTGLVINGEYKYFTDKGIKYNIAKDTPKEELLNISLSFHVNENKNTIKHGDIEVSYNPETLEIIRDDYGRLIHMKNSMFDYYEEFYSKSQGTKYNRISDYIGGIVVNGTPTYFEGSNGFKYTFEGKSKQICIYKKICGIIGNFSGLNTDNNTVYFSKGKNGTKLSYNPENGKILLDEYQNEVLEDNEIFLAHDENGNIIRSGLIIDGEYKSIKENGTDIKKIRKIDKENSIAHFGEYELPLFYNKENLELVKKDGFLVGVDYKKGVFYSFDFNENYLIGDNYLSEPGFTSIKYLGIISNNGELKYISDGNKEFKEGIYINAKKNSFSFEEKENINISYNSETGEIIKDNDGNYIYLDGEKFISYNLDSLNIIGKGIILYNDFLYTEKDGKFFDYTGLLQGTLFSKIRNKVNSTEKLLNILTKINEKSLDAITKNVYDLKLFIGDNLDVQKINISEVIEKYKIDIIGGADCNKEFIQEACRIQYEGGMVPYYKGTPYKGMV